MTDPRMSTINGIGAAATTAIAVPTVPSQLRRRRGPRFSRADRSPLGVWFSEIDRVLLGLVAGLILLGLIAVAIASPVAAAKLSTAETTLSSLHFFYRQLMWVFAGAPIMIGLSMLSRDKVRRGAFWGAVFFFVLLVAVYFIGNEVNGARRWLGSGSMRLQPSEFLKPLFAITLAWILSVRPQAESAPLFQLSGIITAVVVVLLMAQPDLGQTILFVATWFVLVVLAGLPFQRIGWLAGAGVAAFGAVYLFYDNGRNRINQWLLGQGDTFQIDRAHDTITNGGLTGMGLNAGVQKYKLPEAHTDYIFSVIGEEFGLVACMGIVILFVAIVARVVTRLLKEDDQFTVLAATALAMQFGGQAAINMAVNTQLVPSKGMTLPFVSYGGSSFLALCVGMGLLLALTRRNPYQEPSPYTVHWDKP